MIGIIDYEIGNIQSIANGIMRCGGEVKIVNEPSQIDGCSGLILPGVGAYKHAMEKLVKCNFVDPIKESVSEGMPILGICLGMQLLTEYSTEFGDHEGLGLIKGGVIKIPDSPELRLPHIGWNEVVQTTVESNRLFTGIPNNGCFYFVHSYMVECDEKYITSFTDHGCQIPASLESQNIFATQFHPEKSQTNGTLMLNNFLKVTRQYDFEVNFA